MLSVDDAPRNLTLVAFNHSDVCPSAILRHWNFARSDFFKHGSKISAFVTAECSGDILPNEITWVSPPPWTFVFSEQCQLLCGTIHFVHHPAPFFFLLYSNLDTDFLRRRYPRVRSRQDQSV